MLVFLGQMLLIKDPRHCFGISAASLSVHIQSSFHQSLCAESLVAQSIGKVLIRCCSGAWDRASGQSPQREIISHSVP